MKEHSMVPIQSLRKALQLLDILLEARQPLSVTELSARSGFPKSSVHAMLSTMRAYSYIEQRIDGKYYLGMRLYECGRAASTEWDISATARPYMQQLANQTSCTVVISYIDNGLAMNLEQCTCKSGIQVLTEVGVRLPLHATAQGKLYLSMLSDPDARAVLCAQGMQTYTPHTFTALEPLLEHLATIREKGYSVENGEYKIGLRAVCAPVYDRARKPRYALGLVGLFRRVESQEFAAACESVVSMAGLLSDALRQST